MPYLKLIPAIFAFICVSAFADKGPIWRMKLPVAQRALLVPYARDKLAHSAVDARDRRFYSELFDRSRRDAPSLFSLFGIHADRREPNLPFSLPFTNSGKSMTEIGASDFGYCLGFTYILRRLNLLAFYRPESPRFASPEDYFPAIDAIAENRPAAIPGYADLHSFASDPKIAKRIKLHIADTWAKLNVSRQGLGVYADGFGKLDRAEIALLVRNVRKVLSLGVNPIITLAVDASAIPALNAKIVAKICEMEPKACDAVKKEMKKAEKRGILGKIVAQTGNIHVVQTTGITADAAGLLHLRTWDINTSADKAGVDLVIDPARGTATFPLGIDLTPQIRVSVNANVKALGIHPLEKAELGAMLHSLAEYCITHECAGISSAGLAQDLQF